jgi:ABC-2 type transport system permease protein
MIAPTTRFATLLQREWMQHRLGWMVTIAAPLVIALVVLLAGQMQFNVDDVNIDVSFGQTPALVLATAAIVGTGLLTFMLAWLSALLQATGLARRDQQDRSIEFWLSMPVGHVASVTAPLLAHLILFPLAALGIGLLAGHAVSLLVVARFVGLSDWFSLPWGSLLLVGLLTLLRTGLGLLLATLWLSPLVLMAMVASAWLKRWGLPALVAGTVVVGNLLDKIYGNPIVWDLGHRLLQKAGQAFVAAPPERHLNMGSGGDPMDVVQALPAWVVQDGWRSLQGLADPLLVLVVAVSTACVALLILRRQRGS